jgi:hypothetical protein
MKDKFTIEICGDVDLEGMLIYVNHDMQTIVSINYEKGIDQMEGEFFPNNIKTKNITLPLEDFISALEKGKKTALKCAKEDEEMKKNGGRTWSINLS